MKKFVLILISGLLMTVFIAFNYLLWDREKSVDSIRSLESLNVNNNASIDALGREIKNLEDENKQLKDNVNELVSHNQLLRNESAEKESAKARLQETLNQRSAIINKLIQQVDLSPMEAVVKKWVEAIDKGQYQDAFNLQKPRSQDEKWNIGNFTEEYKNDIKSMKLKSLNLEVNGIPEGRKGEIIFKVALDIKKVNIENKTLFGEGINERFFSVGLDGESGEWVISNISITP